ncbi:hypothetical protein IF1G_07565 [Cordyceps javanica]|uniref:Uncharacterized protein n=1 Tax=Cordyceps javanica TaxID=43265 RepID=A0A545UWJ0_9HYPO|nr:hypothetical protein IF1G_07565 [Cordyceps javanica]
MDRYNLWPWMSAEPAWWKEEVTSHPPQTTRSRCRSFTSSRRAASSFGHFCLAPIWYRFHYRKEDVFSMSEFGSYTLEWALYAFECGIGIRDHNPPRAPGHCTIFSHAVDARSVKELFWPHCVKSVRGWVVRRAKT